MTPTSITTDLFEKLASDAHTLAGEHARLMRDVLRRATPVLRVLDARAWPHAELGTLATFLRATVLRQVSDEETLLYPHNASAPPFAELSAEHVRLHTLTAQLERAYREPCTPARLRALVDELVSTLKQHLVDEHRVLAALPDADTDVPSAADLADGSHEWPHDDNAPVLIRLDVLPDAQAVELCIERLLRLRPSQAAEVHASDDGKLRTVGQWIHDFDATRYGLTHSTAGAQHVLRVTRRHADDGADVGYPG